MPADEAQARRRHFEALPHAERVAAIQRMALAGHSVHTIAQAAGVSVEQITLIQRAAVGSETVVVDLADPAAAAPFAQGDQ